MNAEKKPRMPPKRGIRQGFSAFCRPCNWHGTVWYGKGSARDAASELHNHKLQAKCCEVKS